MRPYLAAVGGGILMWSAYPPLDLGWVGILAAVPLLWALRNVERAAGALGVGFVYGFVFFGALLNYVRLVGMVAWIPLVVWLAASSAAYGLLVWAFRHWPAGRWWLVVVGGWGLWELVRLRFPFGGFPWGGLGYAVGGEPGFLGAVQWIGPSGWSILAVGVAAGIVLFAESREHWRLVVDPAVITLLVALAGALFPPSADGEVIRTAIVQGSTPCPQTHCQNENRRIYESHMELTRSIPAGTVDLVVWAENAAGAPYEPESNPEVQSEIAAQAERLDAYLLISGTRSVSATEFLNVNVVYAPNGRKVGEYAKRHPVPFGEFVPLRGALDFIPQLDRVPRDMVRGDGPVVFRTTVGTIGSVISFEGAFPRLVRSEVRAGAEVLVVTTNESTWLETEASDQFIDLTRVNAAAMGQDLIHAAITGKSALITAAGDIRSSTGLLTAELLIGAVQYRTAGLTLYARLGDWVLLIAIAAAVAAAVVPAEGRLDPAA